ncbi:MAG: TRAP transporter small permease [Syntrophales bacterium]|nr:TRAP transporter small permease [Syntrophales bacterium]
MTRLEKSILSITQKFNLVAAAAVVIMMVLTCADVILRFFRHPIPGTYEMVGLLGAIVVSFSLAHTSVMRGHISVEFIVQKLPKTAQIVIDGINSLLGTALFGLITWQSMLYASNLMHTGEVSLTLQMPIYPFVYGIAVGSGMLCVVLLTDFFKSLKRTVLK